MERLPTELVTQILSYMSTKELKIIGFISFKYRSLVIPFLFRRIRPWWFGPTQLDVSDLITCLQNNQRISLVVRVLDAGAIRQSNHSLEEIRQIMEIIARWEELILPTWSELPLAVLDNKTKLQLRRLRCVGRACARFYRLLDILPTFTNLVELHLPDIEEERFESFDPVGSVAAIWMNRLEKYRGPPYPLNYLQNGTPLYHLESTTEIPPSILQRLGGLIGQQLLSLHVHLFPEVDLSPQAYLPRGIVDLVFCWNWNRKNYLAPSLVPSLFPNLQYVAWFLIKSESKAGSVPNLPQTKSSSGKSTLNRTLFGAIQQLHHLRRVWFGSHHWEHVLPEPVSTFIEDVQKESLPYLDAIFLHAPNSKYRLYAFRRTVGLVNEEGYTKWVREWNVSLHPFFD